jgi:hypothetical protein
VTRPSLAWLWTRLGVFALLVALAATAGAVAGKDRTASACPRLPVNKAYRDAVNAALASKQDVWGDALLRSRAGPTYEGVRRYLRPLMLVGRPAGLRPTQLTDSGVYYLAFGQPRGPGGTSAVQLHVADGSQIVSRMASGPSLSIGVGARGLARYGACLARLGKPRLYGGYLPILETSYVDSKGVRYRQESFAARIPQTRALVSFVRLKVDARRSRSRTAYVRFTPSLHLGRFHRRLRQGTRTRLLFSRYARFDGRSLVYTVQRPRPRTVYVAWLDEPRPTRPFRLNGTSYNRAKKSLIAFWERRLATGGQLVVPERRVYDAERNLLIQNQLLSWRYSLGNSYQRFTWELIDVAEAMGAYGYRGVERAILNASLHAPTYFPNRSKGEEMAGTADYFRRFGDLAYVQRVTPRFRRYVGGFERQLDGGLMGLLSRERYGADILHRVYGLHAQVLALQGLRAIAGVWAATGYPLLADDANRVVSRLDAGLRAAVRTAQVALPDGSLFVPIELVDGKERPYDSLTSSKRGSYWNLVMPYVLGSRFFQPGGAQATGLLRYILNHGSRFLGLVRFAPHTGVTNPGYQRPGSDDVYGINVARFLADNHRPDLLLLSLYGKLGAGMTENTFVAGEGSTIQPLPGVYYRSMHRPPNGGNNAFFLEALRLALVHETADGLELAYATPRSWLAPGKRIAVRRLRTSFGPLSYSLEARASEVRVRLDVPPRLTGSLRLRLRLPAGERLATARARGRSFARLAEPNTLDLTGMTGHVELAVPVSGGSDGGA